MIGGTVLACRQTPKAIQLVEATKENLEKIEEKKKLAEENGGSVDLVDPETGTIVPYTLNTYRKDLCIQHRNNIVDLAKTYAVPAVMMVGGALCIMSGHGILKKRNAVAVATLGSVIKGFNKYRSNVIAELGEAADKKYRFGLPAPQKVETVNAETGEVTQETVNPTKGIAEADSANPIYLMYNRATCPELYKGNLLADLATLKAAQLECNNYLSMYGHLTVNRAREIIGAKAIPEGCDNGWVIDGEGDGWVDFGIFEQATGNPKHNIDGNIKALLARPRNARP